MTTTTATDIDDKVTIILKRGTEQTTTDCPISGRPRIVIIINNQFSNAPNTTQIASGAGRSSAAGNNAAVAASNTLQQQGVGANGRAENAGMRGEQVEPHDHKSTWGAEEEVVLVINNQIHRVPPPTGNQPEPVGSQSAATQVASGAGNFSAGGTNSAIESSNTKQQHAVGGAAGAEATNRGQNAEQEEECCEGECVGDDEDEMEDDEDHSGLISGSD